MQTSHSPYTGQSINSTAVKLLQAAGECAGVEKQSAASLGIDQSLPGKLMPIHRASDPLLLRAVDVMPAHRQSPVPLAATRTSGLGGDSVISQ